MEDQNKDLLQDIKISIIVFIVGVILISIINIIYIIE